jgi:hypothetical protein
MRRVPRSTGVASGECAKRLCHFGLSDTGFPFKQEGTPHCQRKENCGRQTLVGQVAIGAKTGNDLGD